MPMAPPSATLGTPRSIGERCKGADELPLQSTESGACIGRKIGHMHALAHLPLALRGAASMGGAGEEEETARIGCFCQLAVHPRGTGQTPGDATALYVCLHPTLFWNVLVTVRSGSAYDAFSQTASMPKPALPWITLLVISSGGGTYCVSKSPTMSAATSPRGPAPFGWQLLETMPLNAAA